MSLPLRILPRAKTDFYGIFTYIEERSPKGAARWREALEKEILRLCENPEQFGYAPENKLAPYELRQLFFRTRHGLTYRVVFTVLDDEVFVLRLRGPGQPPLKPEEMPLT